MTNQPKNPYGLHPSEVHDEVPASDYGQKYGFSGSGADGLEMFSRTNQFTIESKEGV